MIFTLIDLFLLTFKFTDFVASAFCFVEMRVDSVTAPGRFEAKLGKNRDCYQVCRLVEIPYFGLFWSSFYCGACIQVREYHRMFRCHTPSRAPPGLSRERDIFSGDAVLPNFVKKHLY